MLNIEFSNENIMLYFDFVHVYYSIYIYNFGYKENNCTHATNV